MKSPGEIEGAQNIHTKLHELNFTHTENRHTSELVRIKQKWCEIFVYKIATRVLA